LGVHPNSTIYNYADDNTLSYADYDIKNVVQNLESDSLKMLDWFHYNLMKANPDEAFLHISEMCLSNLSS
jgi:hypothetical protein